MGGRQIKRLCLIEGHGLHLRALSLQQESSESSEPKPFAASEGQMAAQIQAEVCPEKYKNYWKETTFT